MQKIIIFRFDRRIRICQNHLKRIRKLNPDLPIHGIYGGIEKDFPKYKKGLRKYFATLYCIKNRADRWKWKNFDLALCDWYKDVGRSIDFDMAYVIEWDLVLLESIEKMYAHIKNGELGLTNLIKLSTIENQWYWTTREPHKSEWAKLLALAKNQYHYSQKPYASQGPGLCFPKAFLEKYSKLKVPDLVHDELRVPLYAQILGFPMKDTLFTTAWFDEKEHKYFNCRGKKDLFIKLETVLGESRKPSGRRAFHPYRGYLPNNSM